MNKVGKKNVVFIETDILLGKLGKRASKYMRKKTLDLYKCYKTGSGVEG